MSVSPITLGKKMELRYIPFSELIIPWEVCVDSDEPDGDSGKAEQSTISRYGMTLPTSTRVLKTLKRDDLEALKLSLGRFGLLKPFEVAELPEQLDFFYGKGKYVVMDGQRRYFALRELLRLPTEQDEKKQNESLRTDREHVQVERAETQAQERFEMLSIRNYVLIPCLVYPYENYLQMVRHSTEDVKFATKPSKVFLEIVEIMRRQGISDLSPDDLTSLWETRNKIEEERQAIEATLHQIRDRNMKISA